MVGWLIALVLGVSVASWVMTRAGLHAWQTAVFVGGAVVTMFVGSKLLFLVEAWPAWYESGDRLQALLSQRMRIPGGFLLLAFTGPLLAKAIGARPLWLADELIPVTGLSIVGVRVGCFFRGCCHGTPSELPWALSFPDYGLAWWWQRDLGLITNAHSTLPVHPLQLYFLAVGLLLFIGLTWYKQRKRYEGEVVLLFALGYGWSTWLLEFLRADAHTFVHNVMLAVCLLSTAILMRVTAARRARFATA